MTNDGKLTPLQKLRAYVAHLEAENLQLRGQRVPSTAAVSLQRENVDLRRQLDARTAPAASAADEEYLTLPEVAQVLGVPTYEVLRNLRESLPTALDDDGNTVVSREDVDAYLLARRQGRPTERFL